MERRNTSDYSGIQIPSKKEQIGKTANSRSYGLSSARIGVGQKVRSGQNIAIVTNFSLTQGSKSTFINPFVKCTTCSISTGHRRHVHLVCEISCGGHFMNKSALMQLFQERQQACARLEPGIDSGSTARPSVHLSERHATSSPYQSLNRP